MKLSTNFVKDYIDIDVDLKTLAEDMTRVGNEYEEAGKLINATNLIIGEILECTKHPDSDHLHICKVNIGKEILNIVCGAPNVRKGLKVIVAQVGAELPEHVVIKKGKIRGVDSEGMMCSMEELGLESKFLTKKHEDGIHELPEDAPVGGDPVKFMGMDDGIIDFELTANRGDLLSILGMAYEIGAIYDKKVKDIDLSHKENGEDINKSFKVNIHTDNCGIFLAKKVENVTIKESPEFIKNRLIASGIRPINNVVDISNYVMLETGQPLHFYDSDSLKGCLEVKMAKQGEKLTTLDNIERQLTNEDIVISDGERAIGLAGVMGGLDTEIESTTKNVIIESAIFNPIKVRTTSKKILRSEASIRFEKGLDPNRTYMAIERACNLLEKYADGTVITGTVKYDKTEKEDKLIKVTFENINRILGIEVPKIEVENVFRKLGFTYKSTNDTISVLVPRRRLDINIKEDLIEEVGRIYGVDNIQGRLPVIPVKPGHYDKTMRNLRDKMISLGLNETLSYILVNNKEAKQYTTEDVEELKLLDPMTEDRNTLRYSIIPSLFKIYEYNNAHNVKDVSIFEIGKGFHKKDEVYSEENKLACLMTGEYYLGLNNTANVDFYIIKGIVEELLEYLGFAGRYSFVVTDNMPKELHPGQSARICINNDVVGIIGKIHPMKAKENIFVFEINLDKLLSKPVEKMKYKEISKYPTVNKDLAIVVDKKVSSQEIETVIRKSVGELLSNIKVFDVYKGENIGENKVSIAYSISLTPKDKTLTEEEINSTLEKIIKDLNKKLGAELRK